MPDIILINRLYFFGGIHIPQVDNHAVGGAVDAAIRQYEPEFMAKLMGEEFYQDFMSGLQANPVEPRWLLLKNGSSYVAPNGRAYRWNGFTNDRRVSPIADYVYYWWMRDRYTETTSSGQVANRVENGVRYSSSRKMVTAWNRMVDLNMGFAGYMHVNRDLYPEWKPAIPYAKRRVGRPVWFTGACCGSIPPVGRPELYTNINMNNI